MIKILKQGITLEKAQAVDSKVRATVESVLLDIERAWRR